MAATQAPPSPPPSALTLFITYGVIGSLLSFLFGRTPGTSPEFADVVPAMMVICFFLVSYSTLDVLGVGITKLNTGLFKMDYKDYPEKVPEQVFLAERAQANQVEQMASFIVATTCFSALVHGQVGAVMGLGWVILRRLYANQYRNSVGVPWNKKGLATYTVPCYFILNSMLMGTVVHGFRWLFL